MPLGVIEWEEYRQVTVDVESGDFFFFYSDGVTEAMNEHHEQFGEKRLIQFFSEKANQHPRHILDQIRKQVVDFSQSESFADDFTCIGVAITEPGINFTLDRNSVQFTSSPYELSAIRRAVVQFCRQNYPLDIESDSLNALVLAVVEASTNIMRHSYHGDTTKLLVMELEAYDHGVLIRLIHEGMTFDPDGYPDPKLEDIGPGGMGLFIIRQCVDDVRYYQDAFGRQCVDLRKTMN